MCCWLSRRHIVELMAAMDTDGNGLVDEEEFVAMCELAEAEANGSGQKGGAAAAPAGR